MNVELKVISAMISSKAAYSEVARLMRDGQDFTEGAQVVVDAIIRYYENDSYAPNVDIELLLSALGRSHPKQVDLFADMLSEVTDVSVPNVLDDFRQTRIEQGRRRLAEACLANDEGKIDEAQDYLSRLDETNEEEDTHLYIAEDIESVLNAFKRENLIRIYPESINKVLEGGVVPGTMAAVYAITEVGKTLFTINMACGLLHDGRSVLYCGNEDAAKIMLGRFYARLSGMTRQEMLINPERARERAFANGYANLVFKYMLPGTLREVAHLVEKYQPEVLIIDQMANMETPTAFTKVEKNEFLATRFRTMTGKYNLFTIIVHQASDSASGKAILEKNDMFYSNIAIQGTLDIMFGIGMDDSMEPMNKRMITMTKNKLTSNHSPILVNVDPHLSRVFD
jgi:archaellum biogenesis ATPase FlaH